MNCFCLHLIASGIVFLTACVQPGSSSAQVCPAIESNDIRKEDIASDCVGYEEIVHEEILPAGFIFHWGPMLNNASLDEKTLSNPGKTVEYRNRISLPMEVSGIETVDETHRNDDTVDEASISGPAVVTPPISNCGGLAYTTDGYCVPIGWDLNGVVKPRIGTMAVSFNPVADNPTRTQIDGDTGVDHDSIESHPRLDLNADEFERGYSDSVMLEDELQCGIVMPEDLALYGSGGCGRYGWFPFPDSICSPKIIEETIDPITLSNDPWQPLQKIPGVSDEIQWIRLESETLNESTDEAKLDICPACCRWISVDIPRSVLAEDTPVTSNEVVNESIPEVPAVEVLPGNIWCGLLPDSIEDAAEFEGKAVVPTTGIPEPGIR